MKDYFSIGEAAKEVNVTSETLRHYDRIGLVKPERKDEKTKYRYYTRQDIVRLNTVRALQQMDLPLQEIKQVLEYNDLGKIVDYLALAEKKADKKIAALQYSKSKIQLAKAAYERKLNGMPESKDMFLRELPARVIMLSDTLEKPSLDNLWNYHGNFYNKLSPELKEQFAFEDVAGIYTEKGVSRLFAVCTRYAEIEGLKVLPAGKYLCADCDEKSRQNVLEKLFAAADSEYGVQSKFAVQQVVVSGILQWKYQIQVPVR